MKSTIIAVYGTLKEGRGNHKHYLSNSKQISKNAKTTNKFALYSSGIPFVTKDQDKTQVNVEVYEVDDETLNKVDRLEGHPNWYRRELTPITITKDDGEEEKLDAWLYFMHLSDKQKQQLKFHEDGNY